MAAAGGTAELIDLLRKTPVILRGLTSGLDDASAQARADDDGWSVVEVIGHLIDAENRAKARIEQLQREDLPHLEGYDQMALVERHAYRSRSLAEVLAGFPVGCAAGDAPRTGRHWQNPFGVASCYQPAG